MAENTEFFKNKVIRNAVKREKSAGKRRPHTRPSLQKQQIIKKQPIDEAKEELLYDYDEEDIETKMAIPIGNQAESALSEGLSGELYDVKVMPMYDYEEVATEIEVKETDVMLVQQFDDVMEGAERNILTTGALPVVEQLDKLTETEESVAPVFDTLTTSRVKQLDEVKQIDEVKQLDEVKHLNKSEQSDDDEVEDEEEDDDDNDIDPAQVVSLL